MSSSTNTYSAPSPQGTSQAQTLDKLLRARVAESPARVAYTFLGSEGEERASLTYRELDRKARAIAAYLQSLNAKGERVLLLYPPGLDYVCAFCGCLYAGAVAVPAYPPRPNQSLHRLQAIVGDARPTLALTVGPILTKAEAMLKRAAELGGLRWLATDQIVGDLSGLWREPTATDPDTPALLQYTSGPASNPRAVLMSHRDLLRNRALIQAAFGQAEDCVTVGWLPLYHDMGLIGNMLQPLLAEARCVLMSPLTFLRSPFRWLEAITRYRATASGGPSFAYDLCARKVNAEQRAALDLSSWAVAFNGAERAHTPELFASTFAECGFRREAFQPYYGLAEATLLEEIEVWLLAELAAKTGVRPADINADQPMARYGLDPLAVVELVHGVEAALGGMTSVMSFPADFTIAQLAAEVSSQLGDGCTAPAESPSEGEADEQVVGLPLTWGQQAL